MSRGRCRPSERGIQRKNLAFRCHERIFLVRRCFSSVPTLRAVSWSELRLEPAGRGDPRNLQSLPLCPGSRSPSSLFGYLCPSHSPDRWSSCRQVRGRVQMVASNLKVRLRRLVSLIRCHALGDTQSHLRFHKRVVFLVRNKKKNQYFGRRRAGSMHR